jgi:catechol-2,3-dioxygenase
MRPIESKKPIPPTKLAHFVLRTPNLERLKEWWMTALGAEVVHENPILSFLTYDDEHHRLALVQIPDLEERPEKSIGLDHLAFSHGSLGALLGMYERLKGLGITPYWCINHGPTTSLYYRDPDGNQVEFQVDNFDAEEELKGWMRSGAFIKNPIGVEFDPEKLLERYRRGDPISELVQQGSA